MGHAMHATSWSVSERSYQGGLVRRCATAGSSARRGTGGGRWPCGSNSWTKFECRLYTERETMPLAQLRREALRKVVLMMAAGGAPSHLSGVGQLASFRASASGSGALANCPHTASGSCICLVSRPRRSAAVYTQYEQTQGLSLDS